MKKLLLLLVIAIASLLPISCKTYELGHEEWRVINTVQKDYNILGTVRVEARKGSKDATYDGLLTKARAQYGEKVDVISIKMDEYQKGDFTWVIMNCYAVEYKN